MNDMELVRQAAGVAAVMLLLAAALWWLKSRGMAQWAGPRRKARRLETVERLALGPQHSLCLVRLGGRGLLIGLSPAGCRLLESGVWSHFEDPEARP